MFVFLIFGFLEVSENIFTPKISGFTVVGSREGAPGVVKVTNPLFEYASG